MKQHVRTISTIIALIFFTNMYVIPTSGAPANPLASGLNPGGRPIPQVDFVELIVPAYKLKPLIGAKAASLRLATYALGRFFEGHIWVVPRVHRSLVAPGDSVAEVSLTGERVKPDDLLFLEIPVVRVEGGMAVCSSTGDWGVEFAKLRLHNRLLTTLRSGEREHVFYIYFDKNIETPMSPFPRRVLEAAAKTAASGKTPDKITTSYVLEKHSSFLLDPRASKILGYDYPRSTVLGAASFGEPLSPSPPWLIDGGGGSSPAVDAVFRVFLYNGSISAGEEASIERYLGFLIAYPKLYLEAVSHGSEASLLVVVKVYGSNGWYDEEAVTYSIGSEPRIIEDYLPIPFSEDEAFNISITFKPYGADVDVYASIFLGKDFPPVGSPSYPPERKPARIGLVEGEWMKKLYYMAGGTVTFLGGYVNGMLVDDPLLDLEIEIQFGYRETPPIPSITLEVYLNSYLLEAKTLDISSGYNKTHLFYTNPAILSPKLEYSIKTGRPVTLTIHIPELDGRDRDEPWIIRVKRAVYAIGFMPDAWKPGLSTYLREEHLLGVDQAIYYTREGSPLPLKTTLVISGFEYGIISGGTVPLGRPRALLEVTGGRVIDDVYDHIKMVRINIYIDKEYVEKVIADHPAYDVKEGIEEKNPKEIIEQKSSAIMLYSVASTLINIVGIAYGNMPSAIELGIAIGDTLTLLYSILAEGASSLVSSYTRLEGSYYVVGILWEGDAEGFLRTLVLPELELKNEPGLKIEVYVSARVKTNFFDKNSGAWGYIVMKDSSPEFEPYIAYAEYSECMSP